MLRKLIAHDFRCTWKLSVTLFVTSMVAALLAMTCGIALYNLPDVEEYSMQMDLAYAGLSLGEALFSMLAYLSAGATLLLSAVHYYKKMLSDEAYLTFTLPATAGQHLFSKMVMGSVWTLVGCIVLFFDSIAMEIPMALEWADSPYNDDMYMDMFVDEGIVTIYNSPAFWIGIILLIVALLITQLALIYLALTIGGVIANKHKAVAGVALYWFGNSIVTFIMVITAVLTSAIIVSFIPESAITDNGAIIAIIYICSIVVAGFGVLYYFLNRMLLTRKLNLS